MLGGIMKQKVKSRGLGRDAVIKDIEKAVRRIEDGKIILMIQGKKIVQVEYLEKGWCQDVWATGGGI